MSGLSPRSGRPSASSSAYGPMAHLRVSPSSWPHVTNKSTGENTVIRVPAAIENGGVVLSIKSTNNFVATLFHAVIISFFANSEERTVPDCTTVLLSKSI